MRVKERQRHSHLHNLHMQKFPMGSQGARTVTGTVIDFTACGRPDKLDNTAFRRTYGEGREKGGYHLIKE